MFFTEKDYEWKPDFIDELFIVIDVNTCCKEEYRTGMWQLGLLQGGNGCYSDHMGRGVFFSWLDGDRTKIDRSNVLGIPSKSALKKWFDKYETTILDKFFLENIKAAIGD